jgi:hypothetical protein
VPGDVQDLVDAVYAHDFTDRLQQAGHAEAEAVLRRLQGLDQRREGTRIAEETLAAMTGIAAPYAVRGDLSRRSEGTADVAADLLTTRLGADWMVSRSRYPRSGSPPLRGEDRNNPAWPPTGTGPPLSPLRGASGPGGPSR